MVKLEVMEVLSMIKNFRQVSLPLATRIILAYHLLVFSHHANLYCRGPSVRVVLGALTYFDAFHYFCCFIWSRVSSLLYY